MTEEERTTLIETAAGQPSSASVDGQSASNRSISELIAWDKYASQKEAMSRKGRGMRITRLVPPGTV
jgi:hypothetical protein